MQKLYYNIYMYIKVKVIAGAKQEKIEKVKENQFKISVKEKAERNMANQRLIEILATEFLIPVSKIRIVSGHHHPSKIFSIMV